MTLLAILCVAWVAVIAFALALIHGADLLDARIRSELDAIAGGAVPASMEEHRKDAR